jgi:NADH-quinone oxidoreductase subunit L
MLGWIPLLPLLGFLINGLWYGLIQTRPQAKPSHAIVPGVVATLAIFGSFVICVLLFLGMQKMDPASRMIEHHYFTWIQVGKFQLDFALRMDALSVLFGLVITGVGTLIHLYSIGYMSHDASPGKFFAYLNLFCFAMLMLVLGSSLPMLFLGWEGVGLCSYLLIGYWYQDEEKASAGKKAFIVNRIGDLGFLLGMFLIFTTFNTLDFHQLKESVQGFPGGVEAIGTGLLTTICLLLFVGCTGKSAQIPLFVWLPDAMAGPTPVSALIHAATMVTSGIYLIARLNFLFVLSPGALQVIAWVGVLTALFAATIAVVQTDIKKVLAYSTVSQLGYMFLACGVGAIGAGVFHVITHAFFKALLFLGAGSVIHGMHEEQDILKMGGLKKYMPITHGIFLIGLFAIAGVPGFSGFFSKDEILWSAYAMQNGSPLLWVVGFITAVLTAFYMTRLYWLTFHGKERFHLDAKHLPHESPWVMTLPLIVLAVASSLGGWMGIPHLSWLGHWMEPVVPEPVLREGVSPTLEWILMALSGLTALGVMAYARGFYSDLKASAQRKKDFASLHEVLTQKWYVDELYHLILVKPLHSFSQFLWRQMDIGGIDRIVLGFGRLARWTGETTRLLQTGATQIYLIVLGFGTLILLGYLIYGNS